MVVDPVAALTPLAEIEGDMGDRNVGLQARLMSQAMRNSPAHHGTNTCCIFINQLREKIGVMFGPSKPLPVVTPGSSTLQYVSTFVPAPLSRTVRNCLAVMLTLRWWKNKVAPPFSRAEFDIMFGEGISKSGEIVDLGVEHGIISKSGSWFSYKRQQVAQGRDAAKRTIDDNPELAEELSAKILEAMKVADKNPRAKMATKAIEETAEAAAPAAADAPKAAKAELDFGSPFPTTILSRLRKICKLE